MEHVFEILNFKTFHRMWKVACEKSWKGITHLGVVMAFKSVIVDGTYTAPQNGKSTSGTSTDAGITTQ